MLFLNRSFDKKRLKALLLWFRLNLSEGAALKAVEILQELGFRSATQGAISLGLDDLKTPANKGERVFQAQLEVALAHHEHYRGNRTPVELFQHLVDTWHRTSQDLTTEVVQLFHSTERVNPVYMMAFSGARGNISQVRQLVGMRGLMADPRGQIVGFPILSNFREGLTITEYFVSCYGARKGVVDTAIRTADAGYLTRRLADVSHHVVVRTTNCGTHRSIQLRDIKEEQKTILSLASRLVGRVLAEHIPSPLHTTSASQASKMVRGLRSSGGMVLAKQGGLACETEGASPTASQAPSHPASQATKGGTWDGLRSSKVAKHSGGVSSQVTINELTISSDGNTANKKKQSKSQEKYLLAYRNSEITPSLASKLAAQYTEISVRSPLSCSLPWGVCQLCYGWGLSEGRRVTLGEAVGIIAAQSIGEPGTQLTLRTFHTGGVFSGELLNEIRAPYNGIITFPQPLQGLLLRTPHGQIAFLTKVFGKMKISSSALYTPQLHEPRTTSALHTPEGGKACEAEQATSALHLIPKVSKPEGAPPFQGRGVQQAPKVVQNADQAPPKDILGSETAPVGLDADKVENLSTSSKLQEVELARLVGSVMQNGLHIEGNADEINKTINQEFAIQPSTVIFVRQKEQVYQNQLLAEFSSSTLQSANDQIEITQQVLSETAGQVWFKELDYGNRKGPGSGFLGTHFSSQNLGGIWVLAGEPRTNTLAFNDRRLFFVDQNKLHTETLANGLRSKCKDTYQLGKPYLLRKPHTISALHTTSASQASYHQRWYMVRGLRSCGDIEDRMLKYPKLVTLHTGDLRDWLIQQPPSSFRGRFITTFLRPFKGIKVIKLFARWDKWKNFIKYQKIFGNLTSLPQNQLIPFKPSIINLRHDYNFFKYSYSLGYSQIIRSIKTNDSTACQHYISTTNSISQTTSGAPLISPQHNINTTISTNTTSTTFGGQGGIGGTGGKDVSKHLLLRKTKGGTWYGACEAGRRDTNTTFNFFDSAFSNNNLAETKRPILGVFDMQFVTSLPLRTIINTQGRYTSSYVKMPITKPNDFSIY